MAAETFRIEIPIEAEDRTDPGVSSATRKLTAFDKANERAQQRLDKMSNTKWKLMLEAYDRVSPVISRVGAAAKGLTGKAWRVTVRAVDMATAPLKGIFRMATSLQGLLLGTAGAFAGVVKPMNIAGDFEQTQVAFETMLGSAEKATSFLEKAQDFANKTPFELPELLGSSKMLMAYGFEENKVLDMMRTIGDTSSGLGAGAEGNDRITRAMGQMLAKGRVQTEELIQLQEMGIPVSQILQEELGLTAQQIANIGNECLSSDIALKALFAGMNKRFGGMMEKQAHTALGLISTIKDTLQNNLIRNWGAGLWDGFKPGLEKITTWLGENKATVDKWSEAWRKAGANISRWVTSKVDTLRKTISQMVNSDEWKQAQTFGEKVGIAWDTIIATPFNEWWNTTGKEWLAGKAALIGEGIGSGITMGVLALLGVDVQGAASDGLSIGASFADGFAKGFDGTKIGEAFLAALKGVFKDAGTIFSDDPSSTSGLSAALVGLGAWKLGKGVFKGIKGLGSLFGGGAGAGSVGSGIGNANVATMYIKAAVVYVNGPSVSRGGQSSGAGSPSGGAAPSAPGGTPMLNGGTPSDVFLPPSSTGMYSPRIPALPNGGPTPALPGSSALPLPAAGGSSASGGALSGGGAAGSNLLRVPGLGGSTPALPGGSPVPMLPGAAGGAAGAGSAATTGLAGVGTALGSGATTTAGAAAAGGLSILGGLLGAVGLVKGAYDIYKGTQTSGKEAKDKYWQGGSKIGMVHAGAGVGAAIGALFGGVGAAPGALIGAGVGGIGALFGGDSFGKWMSDLTDENGGLNVFWQDIKEKSSGAFDFLKQKASEAKDWIGAKWSTFSGWIDNNVWTPAKDFGISAINIATGIWVNAKDAIVSKWNGFSDWFTETVWSPLKDKAQAVAMWMENRWAEAKTWILDTWANVSGSFYEKVWGPLANGAQMVLMRLGEGWTAVKSEILEIWIGVSGWFEDSVWIPLKNDVQVVATWASEKLNKANEYIMSVWSGLSGWFQETVWNPIMGDALKVWESIKEKLSEIKRWLGELGETGAEVTGLTTSQGDGTVLSAGKGKGGKELPSDQWATGGFVTRPHIGLIGEAGPESIIPLSSGRRQRGLDLWEQTGRMLGVRPYADGGLAGALAYPETRTPVSGIPVAVGSARGLGRSIQVIVKLNPQFQIEDGGDENKVLTVIRRHLKEIADEVGGEIAGQLEQVFSNLPVSAEV